MTSPGPLSEAGRLPAWPGRQALRSKRALKLMSPHHRLGLPAVGFLVNEITV